MIMLIGAVAVAGVVIGMRMSMCRCEEAKKKAVQKAVEIEDEEAVGYPYWENE